MKKIRFIILFLAVAFGKNAIAGEGMFMPHTIKGIKEQEMKKLGLMIDAEKIYSQTQASIKDAIVHFGGGCTGEIVSDQGLIITNHHCGFDYIQKQSTVENDLLKKGFWARDKSKELINPGLTVSIIQSTEDVTPLILKNVFDTTSELNREKIIKLNTSELEKERSINNYTAFVKSFNNGGKFYLYTALVFKDVRLVGAPPSSIGKFGEDSDNWMWPRHTGDFSLFRIYADKNNMPAEYSKENVPYKPKYVIPISMEGVKENDFTFVYGFPGKTTEYLSSYAVDFIKNTEDPIKVKLRTIRLNTYDLFMKANDTINLKYASKYSSVSNGWKKWQGEILGLEKLNATDKKRAEEVELKKIIETKKLERYKNIFVDLENKYKEIEPLNIFKLYYTESFLAIEAFNFTEKLIQFTQKIKELKDDKNAIALESELMKKQAERFFKDYSTKVDIEMVNKLLPEFFRGIKTTKYSMFLSEIIDKQIKPDFSTISKRIFKSSLLKSDSIYTWINDVSKHMNRIQNDELYIFTNLTSTYYSKEIKPLITKLDQEINLLNRSLVLLKQEVFSDKSFYPDANSTLRITYGKVEGYTPRNAVKYDYYTTIDGIFEKAKLGNVDYKLDSTLNSVCAKKDFGKYLYTDNSMRTAFIASNHTTGGNSGSPVFNAMGELVGTNFDRNWEGTMSDVMYNELTTRNISLDIHYTLFIIDKIGKAPELISEMNIVQPSKK
ncbi:MAG: S46 family peptidase [Bacteroidota bacterium]